MKQVHANYTFVASTKTITLTGLNIAQDQLLLITNATRGIIYYNFASSSHRAVVTAGANTTVVLTDASTTGHEDSDQLVIHYDDQASAGTVTATLADQQTDSGTPIFVAAYVSSPGGSAIPVSQDAGAGMPISGTVTAQGFDAANELAAPIPLNDGATAVMVQPEGIVYTASYGEQIDIGTVNLTANTAAEISSGGNGVNGFNTVVLEINTNGVTFGSTGIVAQAHNQTISPTDQQIMCPLGVRITHSADSATGLNPSNLGTVGYVNLEPNTTISGYHGTRLNTYENDNGTQTSNLPATGTRFFIFDLTTSRFFLKASFTAGTITVNYRLYRTRHPVFSARKMVVSGEFGGAVRVNGAVDASITGGSVYLDGGYLDGEVNSVGNVGWVNGVGYIDDTASIQDAVFNAIDQQAGNDSSRTNLGTIRISGLSDSRYNGIYRYVGNQNQDAWKAGEGYYTRVNQYADFAHTATLAYGTGSPTYAGSKWRLMDLSNNAIVSYATTGGANLETAGGWTNGMIVSRYQPAVVENPSAESIDAKISTTNTKLTNIDNDLGSTSDASASSDTGTFSLISLFKRLLSRITSLVPANLTVTSTRLLVDGSGVTQPVSGTITANAGTGTYAIQPRNGAVTKTRGTTSSSANTSAAAPSPLNATDSNRRYLLIQNISDTDMYVNFGAAATTDDLLISKNGGGVVFEAGYVPTDSVNVICSAASKKYFILSA